MEESRSATMQVANTRSNAPYAPVSTEQTREALDLMMATSDANHRLGKEPRDYDLLDAMENGIESLRASEGFADYFVLDRR